MAAILEEAALGTFETLPRARRRDPQAVEESIVRAVRSISVEAWGKKPIVRVSIVEV